MRYDVQKYLVIACLSEKAAIFDALQRLGIAQVIHLQDSAKELPMDIQNHMDALSILRKLPATAIKKEYNHHASNVLALDIIEKNKEIELLQEEQKNLVKQIQHIAPFGYFSLAELRRLETSTHLKFQFFVIKAGKNKEELNKESSLIYITTANELDYYVSIAKVIQSYEGCTEIIIEKCVSDLETTLAQVRTDIEAKQLELSQYAYYKASLKEGLIAQFNRFNLNEATMHTQAHGNFFSLLLWVPHNKVVQLQQLQQQFSLVIEQVAIESQDRVPTYLENQGTARLGEDLVSIYDIPSTKDEDPSGWVFFSFILFFSMIISDAGYGALFLLAVTALKKVTRKTNALTQRILHLGRYLAIGCIVWGVLCSSYFGIFIPPTSQVQKLSLVNVLVVQKAQYIMQQQTDLYLHLLTTYPDMARIKDAFTLVTHKVATMSSGNGTLSYPVYKLLMDQVMLEIALVVGVIHLLISLVRALPKCWANSGWILFLIGGYIYFPTVVMAISCVQYLCGMNVVIAHEVGLYLLLAGMGLSVILALIQYRSDGLGEITKVIQVFADVLSYLRIYALSLASMIMAATFNQIASSMPLWIGLWVLLLGHMVNFTLGLMGGVIHGLRLNFIEWYHYSFEGGGKTFSPLKILEVE